MIPLPPTSPRTEPLVPYTTLFRSRGHEAHAAERPGLQAEERVALALGLVEPGVVVVEEQEVLALDVEDQRLGAGDGGAEHPGVEQRVQQEGGVGGLGGHARDAGDEIGRANVCTPVTNAHVDCRVMLERKNIEKCSHPPMNIDY